MKTKRNFMGWRIGGLTLMQIIRAPNTRVCFASWHNPSHMCWLWLVEGRYRRREEGWRLRIVRLPGHQARTIFELLCFEIDLFWQEEGRFKNPSDQRVRNLLGMSPRGPKLDEHERHR